MNTSNHILVVIVVALALLGCSQAPPAASPEGHSAAAVHKPESVDAGVARLKEIRAEIKAAFEAGTPHECDGVLHEASEILLVLPEVATDEAFNAEGMETVKTKSKELFDHFMVIHEGFHGHGEEESKPDANAYDSIAVQVNSVIDALASAVSSQGG